MTHYRMSFDDWLRRCRTTVHNITSDQWWEAGNCEPDLILHEDAADYVRDCIANQTVRDINGRME